MIATPPPNSTGKLRSRCRSNVRVVAVLATTVAISMLHMERSVLATGGSIAAMKSASVRLSLM